MISTPYETFSLRFEDCGHALNIPLMHSSHRGAPCYVCEPEQRDKPVKGKCPQCIADAEREAYLEDFCQAASPNHEPCHHPATVGCTRCGLWFCDAHAEDDEWHSCALPPGEEGGEA